MSEPYYTDDQVTLYHGDMREILPELHQSYDLVVADPPYGETSLKWDDWPDGWPAICADVASSMWVFGSMRMFLARRDDFEPYWNLSQDIVWEKHNGSGFAADRFRRVHEHVTHWYRGGWNLTYHETPRIPGGNGNKSVRTRGRTPHTGAIGNHGYVDDGMRLTPSVIRGRSMHSTVINETQKPVGLLSPLIEYACPPGGIVCDPFAGSCSTLIAARDLGRCAIGIELREEQCERAAKWLAQGVLEVTP